MEIGSGFRQDEANAMLARDFLLFVGQHPELAKRLPKGGHVIFLPPDDLQVAIANLEMAASLMREGEQVTLVKWPLATESQRRWSKLGRVQYLDLGDASNENHTTRGRRGQPAQPGADDPG